jgi:hypothetical protein
MEDATQTEFIFVNREQDLSSYVDYVPKRESVEYVFD